MDSLTHIAVGACIGELFAGKQLGRRAMLIGAALQSLPDIDFIASLWLSPVEDLLAHRGFTHSILFAVLVVPLLAYITERFFRPHKISLNRWILFFSVEVFIHLFLDAFNAYGTGWFEPFSHYRGSINAIFVADPIFSIWPFMAFVALLILKRKDRDKKIRWVKYTFMIAAMYLIVGLMNKSIVSSDVKQIAKRQQVNYKRYFTSPTPFNTLLWYVVLESDSGYYIGHRSVLDTKPEMDLYYFARNEDLLQSEKGNKHLPLLKRFSKGYYTVEKWNDTLVFNDLRFGQMIGWKDPHARFAFHFFLQIPDGNKLVVQRGRLMNWDKEAVKVLLRRIMGKELDE